MNENKIIYLSPSAQEYNIGVGDYGSEEYRMNRIADLVENKLKNQGYMVYRNNPNNTLREIVEESNRISPNIHVALHSNASGGNIEGRGPEIYANREGTPGARLAQDIYDQIIKIYPESNKGRGVLFTNSLYEIINTLAPAVLLEIAFHDNEEDANWIIQNEDKIAQAIVDGINNYFNNR